MILHGCLKLMIWHRVPVISREGILNSRPFWKRVSIVKQNLLPCITRWN